MPIRAFVAALVAAGFLAAGGYFILHQSGAAPSDFIALLMHGAPDGALLCRIAGWASVVFAALTILAALVLFAPADDDEDDDDGRRPGWVALVLLAVALAFFWFALRCGQSVEPAKPQVVTQKVEPPPAEPAQAAPAPKKPALATRATSFKWDYMIPLIDPDGGYHQSPKMAKALEDMFPAADPDGSVAAMLCGKAWVAFTGSSSEEGPPERNERRARVRADLVLAAAQKWLAAHPGCAAPVLLGVDLGQHVFTVATSPEATAYQRQILMLSRDRADAGETVTADEAENELSAFLADPDNVIRFLAGRRFMRAPKVYLAAENPA